MESINISIILSVVLPSALTATVVGSVIEAWREKSKSHKTTQLEALEIAISLEGYAIECANRIADHGNAESSDGHAGEYISGLPDFKPMKISEGFLSPKKASVANNLLTFYQEVRQADQEADIMWDLIGELDLAQNAAKNNCAKMGCIASSLAKQLRSAFRLPNRSLVFGNYDVQELLERTNSKNEERDA